MKAIFYIESGQQKVLIDGCWNSLSLFLESDSSSTSVRNHINLKKTNKWQGNVSTVHLVEGSLFEVSTDLDIKLESVRIYQKQLITLIKTWNEFTQKNKRIVKNV